MEDVFQLQINVDQSTNVNKTNLDVEMVHVDQLNHYVQNLMLLVHQKDHIDVKSELAQKT